MDIVYNILLEKTKILVISVIDLSAKIIIL